MSAKTLEEKATDAALGFDKRCAVCGEDSLWVLDKDLFISGYRDAIKDAAEIYEKAFENNWVVQDTMDAINSLGSK